MKLSVIVPVYNVEKYLNKCLKSLLAQKMDGMEVIIINDGSPDNSQSIIDKYCSKYPNIFKSYNKKNGGLSDARNYGIKKAKGEYITFLDSDDYIEKNMYKTMYDKAKTNDFDVVICDLWYIYDNKKVFASSNIKNDLLSKDKIKNNMLNIYPAAWNKIYKKELFQNNITFKKGIWFEDVEFMYKIIPYINSIGVVKKAFVNYVQRDGAITKTFDDRLFHQIDNWNGIIEYYKQSNIFENYSKELEYCYVRYLYASFIKSASNYKDKNKYKEACISAIDNVRNQFPNYKKNKYFYETGFKGLYLLIFNLFFANVYYFLKKISKRIREYLL